jgi:fructose-specific phosphotransferase system IIA component
MNGRELASHFQESLFIHRLESKTKDHVLDELLNPLVQTGKLKNKHMVFETLKRRETLGSTGIGKGIAIPHCRTLVVSDIVIIVGISPDGIDFDAIDRKPVSLIFLVISPPHEESNRYLPILGKIVELVRDASVRKSLVHADGFSSFVEIIQGGTVR